MGTCWMDSGGDCRSGRLRDGRHPLSIWPNEWLAALEAPWGRRRRRVASTPTVDCVAYDMRSLQRVVALATSVLEAPPGDSHQVHGLVADLLEETSDRELLIASAVLVADLCRQLARANRQLQGEPVKEVLEPDEALQALQSYAAALARAIEHDEAT